MFHPATHLMALEYLVVYTGVLSKDELDIIHLTRILSQITLFVF